MTYQNPSAGRGDKRQNTTDYDHPQETNLLNIHKGMEYDLAGRPQLRVAAQLSGPSIAGQVSIAVVSTNSLSRVDAALVWSED